MEFNNIIDVVCSIKDSTLSASDSFDNIMDMASYIYTSNKFSTEEKKEIQAIIRAMYNQLDNL